MADDVDLYAFPLNVAQGQTSVSQAQARSLAADDAAFVADCSSRLSSLAAQHWQPTTADWNRLMQLAEGG